MKKILLVGQILFLLVWGVSATTAATISGHVTEVGGVPMVNILVIAADETCVGSTIGDARTDVNGDYEISVPPGNYFINTWMDAHPSYYPDKYWTGEDGSLKCWDAVAVTVDSSTPAENINFQLEKGGIVSGTVYQNDGITEITGDSLDACIIQGDPCGDHQYVIGNYTNPDDGSFSISGIPPGTYFFRTYTGDSDYIDEWWRIDGNSLDCNDAQTINVVAGETNSGYSFQLEEGGGVSGYVFDAVTNQPIADILVFAQDQACGGQWLGGANTDENGFYRIHAVQAGPGPVYVRTAADSNGLNYVDEYWNIDGSTMDCNDAEMFTVTAGITSAGRNFQLEEGGYISGKVTDVVPNSIQGVMVGAYSEKCGGIWDGSTSTDENGDYRIGPLPPGEYFVLACTSCSDLNYVQVWWDSGNGSFDCNHALPVTVVANQDTSISDFQLIPGAIVSGTVKDKNGSPLIDVSVDVSIIQGDPCGNHQYVMGRYSNPDGSFSLIGIPEGAYFLRTYPADSNYVSEWWTGSESSIDCNDAVEFTVTEGGTSTGFEFQLEEGGAISGTVREAGTNQEIANVHVYATSGACDGQWLGGGNTDANGFYRINGVLPGPVFVRTEAAPNGFNYVDESWDGAVDCSAATGIPLDAGAEASNIDFNLSPGATISGHVYQQDGTTPIENVHVYVTDADTGQWIGGDNTDATGSFFLTGLPPGECLVHICPSCNDLMYVNELYNDTYNQNTATRISLIPGSDIILDDILLETGNTISGTISGLDPDQWVHIALNSDNGTPEGEDDLHFGRGYPADASGNVEYTITVLPGHLYPVEIYPDGDPRAYYLEGSPAGTFSWEQASFVDPVTNPIGIDIAVTQGVQLSGIVNGLADGQRMWINARCENGTPEDNSDDFDFGVEIWGSATGTNLFSIAVPTGYTFRVCFNQDNGIVACYDGSDDGTFGGMDPNVEVTGDLILNPLTVTPGVTINGTVDNLDPYQHIRVFAHSDASTPDDGADDFSMSDPFDADGSGTLTYSLTVPSGYSYIVEFQPEDLPNAYYLSSDVNGTNDPNMATVIVADADIHGIDLTLPATGSIAGNIFSEGLPLEGIQVHVISRICGDEEDWLASAETDANGHFHIDGLPLIDVYAIACPSCNNSNYFDLWYDGDGGAADCNLSIPVSVFDGAVTAGIDFDLEKGPRRENWTEVSVYDGILGAGFDLLPGFDDLIESATLTGPDGFFYAFDLQPDTFQWINDCIYNRVSWWHDFSQTFSYGDYSLTLRFKDGYEKTYVHHLQQVSLTPVDENSMSHVVNPDGSIDFSFTKPAAPDQWYRVMIYDGGNRYLSLRVQDSMPVHVTAYQLRCLEPGGNYTWYIRVHDLNEPYNATLKTARLPLVYNPSDLQDRVTSFSATRAISQDELWLYFNTRSGSRYDITNATVTGPGGFTYTFDLVDDWFNLSTETRILNGWNKAISLPAPFGDYALNVQFNDGPPENKTFYLPEVTVVPVDVNTIHVYVLENGAGYCEWELPAGVTGQYYQVRIRSTDGLQEFFVSNSLLNGTSHYASPWDLRGLVHGNVYQLFIRAYDADFTTMAQSESVVSVYDPFKLVPPTDIDGDRDVDGADLVVLIQRIQDGLIDDVEWMVELIAKGFGRLQ